jgi:hypothetical protein
MKNKINLIIEQSNPIDCPSDKGWTRTTEKANFTSSNNISYEVKKCGDGKFYKKRKTEPTPSTSLPAWAGCIKTDFPVLTIVNISGNDVVKHVPGLSAKYYFWEGGRFVYVDNNNNPTNGTWECDNGKLIIKTDNGLGYINGDWISTTGTPVELPEWAKNTCIITELPTAVGEGDQVKYTGASTGAVWTFNKNNSLLIVTSDNISYDGKWKCESDILIVNTNDNKEWRSDTKQWKDNVPYTPTPTPTLVDCTPFKDKGEADKFRLWVNTNYPEIAGNIPGLPVGIADKKLSRLGKCTSTHIRTAAEHKINGEKLIDLFRENRIVTQEKNPNEERNNWMDKNEVSFTDGEMKEYPIGGFPLKIYEKIIDGRGFRFFPPKNGNKPMYIEYTDGTFSTPEFKGTYSLSIEESLNKSIKRWLDIMNKNGRPSINEQILGSKEPYLTGRQSQEAELKKKQDAESKVKQTELDSKKTEYKNNLVTTHGLSLTADTIEVNLGKYDVIDLNSDKIYGNPSLFTEPGKDFVYKQKGEVTIEKPQQAQIIKKYADKGYTAVPCNTSQTNDILFFVKLHEKHKDIFTTPYCMVRKETFDGTSLEFNDFIVDNDKLTETVTDKKTCRQLINMYKNASDKKFPIENDASFEDAKQYISRCSTQHKFHFVTNKSLESILASRKRRSGIYGFRD